MDCFYFDVYYIDCYGILKVPLLFCSFFRREGAKSHVGHCTYVSLSLLFFARNPRLVSLSNDECCFATFRATMKIICLIYSNHLSRQNGCNRSIFHCSEREYNPFFLNLNLEFFMCCHHTEIDNSLKLLVLIFWYLYFSNVRSS